MFYQNRPRLKQVKYGLLSMILDIRSHSNNLGNFIVTLYWPILGPPIWHMVKLA